MRASLAMMAVAMTGTFAVAASGQQLLIVRIGHVAQTSGHLAGFGKSMENGARMAVDELNAQAISIGGRKARFELVPEDDGLDPNRAAAVAQTLVDTRVNGIVGHLFSSTSIAASKIYCAAGIPQISPGATVPEYTRGGCKSTFRVVPDDTRLGSVLGRYAGKEMRATRVAVIDDGSLFGQSIVEAFGSAVTATGAKIIATHSTDQRATDFTAILTSIKARNPDLVFFGGTPLQGGPMIKQMKQLGIRARFMGSETLCQADLPQRAGDAWTDEQVVCGQLGGAEFGAAPMGRFRVDFKSRFGTDPLRFAPYAYDAVRVMVDAMVRAGSADPARYLPALAATRDYKGVTGTITFDKRGDIVNGGVSLFTYKDRKRDQIATVP
jgi:branched-chain amino acid transport system substrate-binding protein